jgi:hypothetical protein
VAFTVPKCASRGEAVAACSSLPNIPKIALPLPESATLSAPAFKISLLISLKRGWRAKTTLSKSFLGSFSPRSESDCAQKPLMLLALSETVNQE